MVEVTLRYHGKILTGIEARGHSGFAEKGNDIVCAAVSTLMQALVFGLSEVAKVNGADYHVNDRTPIIRVTWPASESMNISLLTKTISESLKIIARDNPRHVKIYSEVK